MKLYFLLFFVFSFNLCFSQVKFDNTEISIENLLQKYIQIPSVSGNEKEAGDFIKSVCKENGLIITDFGSENGNYNFAASIYPLSSEKQNIIFLNHLDVIPENNESEDEAYSGKIIDTKIYGRGAIDNKGTALMQLYGILQLLNDKEFKSGNYNITFLAVSCEETQCEGGVKYVIENYLDVLNPIVVIGEGPSELATLIGGTFKYPIFGVSVAHKRAFWLKLELENHTNGHGAVTPLEYGNKSMVASLNKLIKKKRKSTYNDLNIRLLKSLSVHEKGFKKLILRHPKLFKPILIPQLRKQPEIFALFSNTITLTNIYTDSDTYNKIPTKTGAYLDCRLLPSTDENEFLKDIKKRLNNDAIKITVVENMTRTKPSSITNIYYRNFENAILNKYPNAEVLPLMSPNINDLGYFRAKNILGFASIPVYLPYNQAESIHNKNEHISIQLLYDGAEVYYTFLKNLELEADVNSKK